jgi:DNA-binding NarL/FixJ family response regulator
MQPISVLVVDDHQVFADALQVRLGMEDGLGPISVAYGVADAMARIQRSPVDVALVDHVMIDGTGVALVRDIAERAPATRVVVVSAAEPVDAVVDALVAGARGWLPKMIDTDHLVRVIRGVHAGEIWLGRALLGEALPRLLARFLSPEPDPLAVLTVREREVLACMVEGLTRAQIAGRLRVSGNTVRAHTQNLTRKLGVHTSLEAVTLALGRGPHDDSP